MKVKIHGMTCTSCEVVIERKLKKLPGVRSVHTNYHTGECTIETEPNTTINRDEIGHAIAEDGYTVEQWGEHANSEVHITPHKKQWREIGVVFVIVLAAYWLLKSLGVFSLSTNSEGPLSLGAVFLIGIVAAVSTCIAVVGGLLLSAAAKYNELRPHATGWQKFKPHILFNLGRLTSYFVLGGVIGLLGKALTPSPQLTGILTILISLVMILLAIDILKLFTAKKFIPRMPKWLSHKIHDIAESNKPWAPLALGALTFFLPCGFTQSMQLYALTTGDFWNGALTMFVFALGTMPALLSLGAVSSFAKGSAAKYVLKFSGVVVLVLALYNISNGLQLVGFSGWFVASNTEQSISAADDPNVEIINGTQVIKLSVNGLRYSPDAFTLRKDMPVEWHIDGSQAAGCAQVMTIPKLGITEYLSTTQETVIEFTPTVTGPLPFMCSMGMARGMFTVVDNLPEY